MHTFKNLIVIGASAGGIGAVSKVVATLPNDIDAAVIVVIHVSRKSDSSIIASILQRYTELKCHTADNGTIIRRGNLYVAQPDHQLLVKAHALHVTKGPHENKYRPAIDVLFRSAAVSYGNRCIGVILTGLMEDGTSGMWAIKRSGGRCIVQDPAEAQFADMPQSVLNKISVDNIAPLSEIGALLNEMLSKPLPEEVPIPEDLIIEADITDKMMSDIDQLKKIATHSDFVCPECGGGLWEVNNDPVHRYRCHTGHVYTEKLLNDLQDEQIEESIWVSVRMLEEKSNMLGLMAKREHSEGDDQLAETHQRRLDEVNKHINRLKSLLRKLHPTP